jgi:DNA-binding transcriptional ArsR family regulator
MMLLLGLTQPTISHHLKILVDAGMFTRGAQMSDDLAGTV